MSVALFGVGGGVWGFSFDRGRVGVGGALFWVGGGGQKIFLGGQRWVKNIFGWGGAVGALFDNAQGFHLRE